MVHPSPILEVKGLGLTRRGAGKGLAKAKQVVAVMRFRAGL